MITATTSTSAVPTIPGLDPLLLAEFDLNPRCQTLLCALSDSAAEAGALKVAEGLRWLLEKGRSPVSVYSSYPIGYYGGWYRLSNRGPDDFNPKDWHRLLPPYLARAYDINSARNWPYKEEEGWSGILRRFLSAWLLATDRERQQSWDWVPPVPPPW